MIGILLALVLSQSQSVQCTAVNFNVDYVQIHCDGELSDRAIPQYSWPKEWHAPLLTAKYNAELRGGKLIPIATPAPAGLFEGIRLRTLREQQRWRRPALQQPIGP